MRPIHQKMSVEDLIAHHNNEIFKMIKDPELATFSVEAQFSAQTAKAVMLNTQTLYQIIIRLDELRELGLK